MRLTGEVRIFDMPADSGNMVSRGFFPTCGSPVHSTNSGMPGMVVVRASSLDDPGVFEPQMVTYAKRAVDGVPSARRKTPCNGRPRADPTARPPHPPPPRAAHGPRRRRRPHRGRRPDAFAGREARAGSSGPATLPATTTFIGRYILGFEYAGVHQIIENHCRSDIAPAGGGLVLQNWRFFIKRYIIPYIQYYIGHPQPRRRVRPWSETSLPDRRRPCPGRQTRPDAAAGS